jgi:hypothetical protein
MTLQEQFEKESGHIKPTGIEVEASDLFYWHEKFIKWLESKLSSQPEKPEGEVICCVWEITDDETETYITSCGQEFVMLDGSKPTDFNYCCYCGKKLSHT